MALKAAGAAMTGSSAVLSDALEGIVNVVAAGVALSVVRFASQPADREHPYGHGKAEFVSAAFEGGLIAFAAIAIALESLRALSNGVEIRALDEGTVLMVLAGLGNLLLGFYLRGIGRRAKSEALIASSAHVLSDVKTTVGVVIGLVIVKLTGLTWIDPVVALLVAMQLGWEGASIVRRSLGGLIDEMDESSLLQLSESIRQHRQPGIIDIHKLRAIRSGSFHHIDAHLVVPEFWDVNHVHDLTHEFESKVVADYPYDGEFAFHVDPCRRQFCRRCDVPSCPIRRTPFQQLKDLDAEALLGDAEPTEM